MEKNGDSRIYSRPRSALKTEWKVGWCLVCWQSAGRSYTQIVSYWRVRLTWSWHSAKQCPAWKIMFVEYSKFYTRLTHCHHHSKTVYLGIYISIYIDTLDDMKRIRLDGSYVNKTQGKRRVGSSLSCALAACCSLVQEYRRLYREVGFPS